MFVCFLVQKERHIVQSSTRLSTKEISTRRCYSTDDGVAVSFYDILVISDRSQRLTEPKPVRNILSLEVRAGQSKDEIEAYSGQDRSEEFAIFANIKICGSNVGFCGRPCATI